jgi:hypothetical protein
VLGQKFFGFAPPHFSKGVRGKTCEGNPGLTEKMLSFVIEKVEAFFDINF